MQKARVQFDPAELVEHREFVRTVARRLLRDETQIEDVVQDTMVAALRSPPSQVRSMRAWLGRVGRNFAIDRIRRERRRASREKIAARPESVASAYDLCERLERHRLVVDAVLTLPEPFRATVLLRFHEQLTPARIAAAQGVPVATVKSRLRRAFELLRLTLDRSHGGDRTAWSLALLPLAGLSPGKAAAATTGGLLVMKKLTAALVAIALLGTFWITWNATREDPAQAGNRHAESAREEIEGTRVSRDTYGSTSGGASVSSAPGANADRAESKPNPDRESSKTRKLSPAQKSQTLAEESSAADRAGLRLRVVDAHDRPIADTDVNVTLIVGGVGRSGPSGKTDAAGIAFLDDLDAEEAVAVHVRAGEFSRSAGLNLTPGRVTEFTVPIPGGFAVQGTVRHVKAGPIEGVMVSFARTLPDGFRDRVFAFTDKDGRYRASGVPAGKFSIGISGGRSRTGSVTVGPDGTRTEEAQTAHRIEYHERNQGAIEVVPPGPLVKDIVLGKPSIGGTVRDAATGAPLPGVSISVNGPAFALTSTNDTGAFSIASLPAGTYNATLKKNRYVLSFLKDITVADNDPARVEWTLEPGARLEITLRDENGQPVTGEHWIDFAPKGKGGWSANLMADANGVIVSETVPVGAMTVHIKSGQWKSGPVETLIEPGVNKVTIEAQRARSAPGVLSLSGFVRDAVTKLPVKGVRLRIHAGMTHDAYTDAAGAYRFEDLPPRSYQIWVNCEGYGNRLIKSARVKKGEETKLEFELEPAATVHLRLTDGSGRPVSGALHLVYVRKSEGAGRGVQLKTDEDGRVTFRRFPPDDYSLTAIVKGKGRGNHKCAIRPGENTVAIELSPE